MLEKDQFQRLRFQTNMQIDCFSFIKILPKVLFRTMFYGFSGATYLSKEMKNQKINLIWNLVQTQKDCLYTRNIVKIILKCLKKTSCTWVFGTTASLRKCKNSLKTKIFFLQTVWICLYWKKFTLQANLEQWISFQM